MDETRIYSVDSETFNKLSHANDELIREAPAAGSPSTTH